MGPLFSVVLPSYNRAGLLRAAVRSVLRQDCGDFELLVVDDGSTDATPDLAREFRGDERISWTRQERNRGQHACRNEAIRHSSGRFITFLDSDDLYLPGRLEAFRRAISARPSVGFWFSNAYLWRYGRVIGTVFDENRRIPEGKLPGSYAVGERHLPYLTSNLVLSREAFDRTGLFREDLKILEDTELYARMLASGVEVGVVRECLAVRRLHEGQITADYARDFEESLIAFKAGGASPEDVEAYRKDLARQVAVYFLKDLQPHRARKFLELSGATGGTLSLMTYAPLSLLRLLKSLRRVWLSCGPRPWGRRGEFRKVEELVRGLESP